MSATDLESLRNRLDSLGKRAGASTVLAEMLSGQVARQETEIADAKKELSKLSASIAIGTNFQLQNE